MCLAVSARPEQPAPQVPGTQWDWRGGLWRPPTPEPLVCQTPLPRRVVVSPARPSGLLQEGFLVGPTALWNISMSPTFPRAPGPGPDGHLHTTPQVTIGKSPRLAGGVLGHLTAVDPGGALCLCYLRPLQEGGWYGAGRCQCFGTLPAANFTPRPVLGLPGTPSDPPSRWRLTRQHFIEICRPLPQMLMWALFT